MRLRIATAVVALGIAAALASATPATSQTPSPGATPHLSQWQQEQLERFHDSAPADEYFGKMKMSYLGMNNTFHDASISSGEHTTDPAIIHRVALAEDALDDWARKYPRDPQLARTYYLAVDEERRIWVKANQERAWTYFHRIVTLFPDTYFGKLLRRDLSIGFTEHYYADAVACPTAAPAGVTPAEPTPTPAPVATTLEPGLHVEILPTPCIPASALASPSTAPAAPGSFVNPVGSPSPGAAPAASPSP